MSDQPEAKKRVKANETEDAEADFEGHKVKDAPSETRAATDDDGADFEGHRLSLGPEKKYKKA